MKEINFPNHEWQLEGDPARFAWVAEQFSKFQQTGEWVRCWNEINSSVPFFAMPKDAAKLDKLNDLVNSSDLPEVVRTFEAEGESLAVFALAERGNILEMGPDKIQGWMSHSQSVIVASVGLYAMGVHGRQLIMAEAWDDLSIFLHRIIDGIHRSGLSGLDFLWNVMEAISMIFECPKKATSVVPLTALDNTLGSVVVKMVKDPQFSFEKFAARFGTEIRTVFDCAAVHVCSNLPVDADGRRAQDLVIARLEYRLRNDRYSVPKLMTTYVDTHFSNLLAGMVLDDDARHRAGQSERGWLHRTIDHQSHPDRDWDSRDAGATLQRDRWLLWLVTIGCIAVLKVPTDKAPSFLERLLAVGGLKFWYLRRWVADPDLQITADEMFLRVLEHHSALGNSMQIPQRILLSARSPKQYGIAQRLVHLLPPEATDICEDYRKRLLDWWLP